METNADHSHNRKDSRRKKNSDLLSRLVDTRFFRFLIGIPTDAERQSSAPKKGKHAKKQSIFSQIVDVCLFVLLVLIAPFINILRRTGKFIGDRWWVKFMMGVVSGVSVLTALFLLLKMLWRS